MTSQELVILCSRKNLTLPQRNLIDKYLSQNIDWENVLKIAQKEKVAELLYSNLKIFPEEVPSGILKNLKRHYLFNLKRNLTLFHILKPLLKSIKQRKIRAVLIKGSRLVKTVYQDPALRSFVDIDFFVAPRHRKKLLTMMKNMAFQFPKGMSPDKDQIWVKDNPLTFRPLLQKGICTIEIHHSLPGLHRALLNEKDLWNSIREITVEGAPAKVLSLEYEFCLLCLHAQQHSYSLLMWMVDIAELASKTQLNWNKVLQICKQEKIEETVYYTLILVNELWERTIPISVLKKFSPSPMIIRMMQWAWPRKKIRRRQIIEFPMHAATFFSVLSEKNIIQVIKTIIPFLFPSRRWVAYYYKIPQFSWRMIRHYFWRVTHPVIVVARQFLRLD